MNTANIGQRPTPMPSGIAEATDTLEDTLERDTLLDWYFPDPEDRARMEDIIAEEEGEDDDASRQYDGESPAWCKYCYTTHDKWSIASDCIVPGWECGLCGHVTADEWIEVYSPEPPAPEPEPAAPETKPHVAYNAGNNEWYTPPEYIAAAIEVMGGIDLDPATTPKANEVVGATRIYTADDDGLFYPWQGRVWMNPPYASELVGKFASKLAQHVQTGDVTDAIVLVNNATETGWFYTLTSVASAVVFPKGRVRFWEPNGAISAPLQGQAVVYIGPRPDLFLNAYRQFGWGATLWQHN
jgi:phage N-6-adenine-methyltransferase